MFFVTWINSLWAVSAEKIYVVLEARCLLQNWHALFFGATRIDGRLVNHDVALLESGTNGLRGFQNRTKIRSVRAINGSWNSDNKDIGFFELVRPGELVSRIIADTTLIQVVLGGSAAAALRNFLLLLGGLMMMATT